MMLELNLEIWVNKEVIIDILLSMTDKYLWGDIYAKI